MNIEPCNRIHKMVNAKMKSDTTIFFIKNDFLHKDTVVICHIYLSNLFGKKRIHLSTNPVNIRFSIVVFLQKKKKTSLLSLI